MSDIKKTIIFDWKRTLYDPDSGTLMQGARELLDEVSQHNLYLIGKGGEDMQSEVLRLQVADYFEEILFIQGSKNITHYQKYVTSPHDTIVIGDRVRSEIEVGNLLNATTIWVRAGKFKDEEPLTDTQKPDVIVSSLTDVFDVIKTL